MLQPHLDEAPNAAEALEDVIAAGCARVLTSGLCKTAMEGADVLTGLVQQASGRIIIMPGGTVRSSNLEQLMRLTGATEFHSAALINKQEDLIADKQEVAAMSAILAR